jgi:hypothetical protein
MARCEVASTFRGFHVSVALIIFFKILFPRQRIEIQQLAFFAASVPVSIHRDTDTRHISEADWAWAGHVN